MDKLSSGLRLGPFDLHPRLSAGLTYDDNILFATTGKEADAEWLFQPAVQAVAGDDAALIAYRDQNNSVLTLTPGNLIIQEPEDRPGKLFILDYGPRFQLFDKYTANNSIDEFATVDLLYPMNKLILGFKQDYQFEKETIVEAGQRTTVESIPTTLSAAYQFGDKTSIESDFHRLSVNYNATGLTGYSEYNTEDWFNYAVQPKLNASVGVLAGWDIVTGNQNQTFEQLRVRARYYYTEKLTFDASVGGELRQYENGSPSTLTPVFTIAAQYQLSERTTFRLTGYRQIYAAVFNGYNYASTGATLDVAQGITDRVQTDLSVGYYSLNYTPTTGSIIAYSDGYYTARFTVQVKIIRHLTGLAYGQWLSRQSPINGNVNDDQAGLQLTFSF